MLSPVMQVIAQSNLFDDVSIYQKEIDETDRLAMEQEILILLELEINSRAKKSKKLVQDAEDTLS